MCVGLSGYCLIVIVIVIAATAASAAAPARGAGGGEHRPSRTAPSTAASELGIVPGVPRFEGRPVTRMPITVAYLDSSSTINNRLQ
eukprot:4061749-Prymnesium_polylepis.1